MAIYYISTTGSDTGGTGTILNPWSTLYYACTHVTSSGNTIHVNAGTYTETNHCDLSPGVSIIGDGSGSTIINGNYASDSYSIINLISATNGTNGNQTISDIKLNGGLTGYTAITIRGRSNVSIHDCYISNFAKWGIIFDGRGTAGTYIPATGNTFYNNTLYNCAGDYDYDDGSTIYNYAYGSLSLDWQEGILIHDNTIQENVGRYGYGIKFYHTGFNRGVKIYNNHIEVAHLPKPDRESWNFAIESWNNVSGGTEIYNNRIIGSLDLCDSQKGNYDYGFYVHDNIMGFDELTESLATAIHVEGMFQYLYIKNNIIKNISNGLAITIGDETPLNLHHLYVQQNIFYNIGNTVTAYGGGGTYTDSVIHTHTISDIYIDNNVFIGYRDCLPVQGIMLFDAGNTSNYYIRNNVIENFIWSVRDGYYYGETVTIDNLKIQNNDFYDQITTNTPYFQHTTPTNYIYTNNIFNNPLFISSVDFHLQSGSTLIDAGIDVGLPYKGSAPDIGCYEYDTNFLTGSTYYLSPSGNDTTGDGTIENPWFSLNKAWTVIYSGCTVYLRGGTYEIDDIQYLIDVDGVSGSTINIWNYPNEIPIITESASFPSQEFGIYFVGDYFHWRGLEITGFVESGVTAWQAFRAVGVSHCIFERFNYHHNHAPMVIASPFYENCDDNLVLNCDFHHNQDPYSDPPYENCDGLDMSFIPNGFNNTIRGCRFWYNADDGLDLWENDSHVLVENCWSFLNGYINDTFEPAGNGNGFKLGHTTDDFSGTTLRTIKNCLSAWNRNNGIDNNGSYCDVTLYNNTCSFNGMRGFYFYNPANQYCTFKNNLSYENGDYTVNPNHTNWIESRNSWNLNITMSNDDFISTGYTQLTSERQSDGSLPSGVTYMNLSSNSELVDAGTYVGISYSGNAPDVGYHESSYSRTVPSVDVSTGLISYWKLDESSGVAIDSVGPNNLSSNGVTQGVPGKINTCYYFSGGNYIGNESTPTLLLSSAFTFSLWLKTSQADVYVGVLTLRHNIATLIYYQDITRSSLTWYGGVVEGIGFDGIGDGNWHHIVVTFNKDRKCIMYDNGTIVGISDDVSPISYDIDSKLIVGENVQGSIDEIGFWNRELSTEDVLYLYNNGNGRVPIPGTTTRAFSIGGKVLSRNGKALTFGS